MIKVIDDFLNPGYYNELEAFVLSGAMQWHFLPNISGSYGQGYDEKKGNFGYFHELSTRNEVKSEYFDFFKPLLLSINNTAGGSGWLRSRLDMTTYTGEPILHDPHLDFDEFKDANISCVFYIGDSDGDTVIYNERKENPDQLRPREFTIKETVSPKANRLVLFTGNYWHTGHSPANHDRRVILNSNYSIESYD